MSRGRAISYSGLVLLSAASFWLISNRNQPTESSTPPTVVTEPPVSPETPKTAEQPSSPPASSQPTETPPTVEAPPLPSSYDIAVPFAVQAPKANWDAFHEEACEEASVLMVNDYFDNRGTRSAEEIDQGLAEIAVWERKNLGTDVSVPASDVARILNEYLKLEVRLLNDPTADQLRSELSQNHPIIVPAHGRSLKNPYFKLPGPIYHMLVLRGYTQDKEFITNDPGTKRGESYRYSESVLMNAIHDWNNGQVAQGAKVAIVIKGKLP